MFRKVLAPVYRQQMYDDLLLSTRRALMLKTMQTAFVNQKCREEAYHFLKHPEKSLADFNMALKQAESAAAQAEGRKQAGKPVGHRGRINALGLAEDEGEPGMAATTEGAESFSSHDLAEMIAAFRQSKKAGGAKPASKPGKPKKQHADKTCDFCFKLGHVRADCFMFKGIKERKAASGKVAASQSPSEN
jgi:hypothetical protein